MGKLIRALLQTVFFRAAMPFVRRISGFFFKSSGEYWEQRYLSGGTSGSGSEGRLAKYKADFLNNFVHLEKIGSVIELGCGDGNQLLMAEYPAYIGLDVSLTAVCLCVERHGGDPRKSFFAYEPLGFYDTQGVFSSDLAISLDVIYHLVEDDVYFRYMKHLFSAAKRWVIIYSSNYDSVDALAHVRHRKFTDYVEQNIKGWKLLRQVDNKYGYQAGDASTSFADFFVYVRCD